MWKVIPIPILNSFLYIKERGYKNVVFNDFYIKTYLILTI